MSLLAQYPHERRAQRASLAALAASVVLGLVIAGFGAGRIDVGVPLPALLLLASLLLGALAVLRRIVWLAVAAAAVSLGGIALAQPALDARLLTLLSLAYALATLAFGELAHVTQRYEKAHRVVEKEHVSEDSLNRVTAETLKTLATRSLLSAGAVGLGVGLAWLLRLVGPRQWRDALETTAPLGVALATLTLFAAASLYVLSRGARLRSDTPKTPEVEPHVAE